MNDKCTNCKLHCTRLQALLHAFYKVEATRNEEREGLFQNDLIVPKVRVVVIMEGP